MSYSVSGTMITLTRGDTFSALITITDLNDNQYIPMNGDRIRFAMKNDYNDETPLLIKEIPIDTMILTLNPEDTKHLPFGKYVYDIELTTAYVSGNKLTGTMKNNGAVTKKITTRDEEVTIPQGFHDGSGKVGIDATEKGKLIANNIREGVTILGVEGTMSGSENMKPQAKTVTPSTAKQTILPDTEYNCLSQVEVEAIPYVEADNPAGGVTVTIAG